MQKVSGGAFSQEHTLEACVIVFPGASSHAFPSFFFLIVIRAFSLAVRVHAQRRDSRSSQTDACPLIFGGAFSQGIMAAHQENRRMLSARNRSIRKIKVCGNPYPGGGLKDDFLDAVSLAVEGAGDGGAERGLFLLSGAYGLPELFPHKILVLCYFRNIRKRPFFGLGKSLPGEPVDIIPELVRRIECAAAVFGLCFHIPDGDHSCAFLIAI